MKMITAYLGGLLIYSIRQRPMKVDVLCALAFFLLPSFVFSQTVIDLTNNPNTTQSWTVPAGVNCIIVEAWGGGGGGGRSTNAGVACSGGGGGAYAMKTMSVTPGQTIQYFIGNGGAGSSGANNGGDTWFNNAGFLLAKGGKGTANNSQVISLGGSAAESIGDATFSGGNGGPGSSGGSSKDGGGGGGAAGTTANGMNGGPGDNNTSTVGTNGTRQGGSAGAGYSFPSNGRGGNGTDDAGDGLAGNLYASGGGGGKNPQLWVTNHDGGNGRQGVIRITVNTNNVTPAISISSSPAFICSNTIVTFTATLTNGGTNPSIVWKKNNTEIAGESGITYTGTGFATGDVITAAVVSDVSCAPVTPTESNAITLTIENTITNTVNETVCSNTLPYVFGGQTLTSGGTYTESFPAAAGCDSIVTLNLTVVQLPVLTVQKTDVSCSGGSDGSAVVAVNPAGNYNYSWAPAGGSQATANNMRAGIYTVTVSAGVGCSATESVTIEEPSPLIVSSTVMHASCNAASGSIAVNASGGTVPYTYTWTPNAGTGSVISNLNPGTYAATVTDAKGCTAVVSENVINQGVPHLAINSRVPSCADVNDGAIQVTVNGGMAPYTYTWTPAVATAGSLADNLGEGTYKIKVTDASGCSADTTVVLVAPDPLIVSVDVVNADCKNQGGALEAIVSGGTGTYTYLWSNGITTATQNTLSAGTYTLTVTDINNCTVSVDTQIVTEGIIPFTTEVVPAIIDEGGSANMNVNVDNTGLGIISYSWSPSGTLSCGNCPNPIATPSTYGEVAYTVTVSSEFGCTTEKILTIYVKQNCGDIFVPTSFSPNGDGVNDLFKIYGRCITSVDMKIYNRWGELIYRTASVEDGWDGMMKGRELNPDMYAYVIEYTLNNGISEKVTGNVSLIK